MVQEQFHPWRSEEFIFYPKKTPEIDQDPPAFLWIHDSNPKQYKYLTDDEHNVRSIEWVNATDPHSFVKTGEALPCGLSVVARGATWEIERFQRRVLPSWFNDHNYNDPFDIPESVWVTEWVEAEPVPPTADLRNADILRWQRVIEAVEFLDGKISQPELFHRHHQQVRYPDQNFHDAFTRSAGNFQYTEDSPIDPDQVTMFIFRSPILLTLLLILPAAYGGLHLMALGYYKFPTNVEQLLWKLSSIDIIATMPVFFILTGFGRFVSRRFMENESVTDNSWATCYKLPGHAMILAYGLSRAYIVVESFISLRAVPIGIYLIPPWVQMIPHI